MPYKIWEGITFVMITSISCGKVMLMF